MSKNALNFGGSSNSNWKKGVATFKFKGKKVKIVMEDEKYIFTENLLPEFPKKIREKDTYFVELRLDEDGDVADVSNIRPAKWMGLKMQMVDMTRPSPDEDPAPYSYTANYSGKEVEETCFYMFWECVDPESEFFGVRFPNRYFYKFKNDGNGMVMWDGNYDNPKATRLHRVVDHLAMVKAVEQPIEWPEDDNILPTLLARALAAGVVVETAGGGKFAGISEMIESKSPAKPVEKNSKPSDEDDEDFDDSDEKW